MSMTVAVRPPRSLRIQIAQFQQFKRYVSPPNKPLLTICVMGTLGVPLQVVQCHSKAKINDMSGNDDYKTAKSIYDFSAKDTHGKEISLDKYKGNVVLIVNIASKCGLAKSNYAKLTELKQMYGDKGLKILNFPCNQFASEMPEADGEPMECHLRDAKADIGDVFKKINVNGVEAHPVYNYLKEKQGGILGDGLKWNFTKFLVNREGIPVNRYAPTTDPMDIAKDIENLL